MFIYMINFFSFNKNDHFTILPKTNIRTKNNNNVNNYKKGMSTPLFILAIYMNIILGFSILLLPFSAIKLVYDSNTKGSMKILNYIFAFLFFPFYITYKIFINKN